MEANSEQPPKRNSDCSSDITGEQRRAFYENRSAPSVEMLKDRPGFEYLLSSEQVGPWVDQLADKTLMLDIGAGMGRFLMAEAEKNRDVAYLGIDPDYQCVKKNLEKLDNRDRRDIGLPDVRFFFGSVYNALPFLPAARIKRAYVNYPDPWFKRRHKKRRLVTEKLFSSLHPLLVENGEVFVQTDIDDYAAFIHEELDKTKGFNINRTGMPFFNGLAGTLYQEKAVAKDHNRHCFVLIKS